MKMHTISIITGASSGLGRQFAIQLASCNDADEYYLIARNVTALNDTKNLMIKKGIQEKDVKIFPMDLSQSSCYDTLESILKSEKDFCIKTLVNNAGFGTYGEFTSSDFQEEIAMINTNVTSLVAFCYKALPYMKEGGRIVNVCSLAAFSPVSNFSIYAATKAFVFSFSLSLRAELASRKIAVCALCPGPCDTAFALRASGGKRQKVLHAKDTQKVVKHCLLSLEKNKAFCIKYLSWKIVAMLSSFAPKTLVAWWTFHFAKRPHS